MNDLIIGACDKYQISQIKNWVKSINVCGFTGKKVMIVYRSNADVIKFLTDSGFEVINANLNYFAQNIEYEIQGRDTQAHQMRFFHIWQYLNEIDINEIRYIITTDTRDVVFQKNPSEWLENNLKNYEMLGPSESIYYKNENWNEENMVNGFGPYIWEYYAKELLVCNVGTIAGKAKFVKDFSLINYLITVGHYIPSDQSAFNLFINSELLKNKIKFVNADDQWACQCATLIEKRQQYGNNILNDKPKVINNFVCNSKDKQFYLVHQYDRIPELNNIMNIKYT